MCEVEVLHACETGVETQVSPALLDPLDQKATLGQSASPDSKAHQAGKEMLDRLEILDNRVRLDSQDRRVQLANLETRVLLVNLDGLVRQEIKDKLDRPDFKVFGCCILT